jgi:hypothetical protein
MLVSLFFHVPSVSLLTMSFAISELSLWHSFVLYLDIQSELEPDELLNTYMKIMLSDKTLRVPMGVIKDVPISVSPYTYSVDFVVDILIDSYCDHRGKYWLQEGDYFSQVWVRWNPILFLKISPQSHLWSLGPVFYETPNDNLERSLL